MPPRGGRGPPLHQTHFALHHFAFHFAMQQLFTLHHLAAVLLGPRARHQGGSEYSLVQMEIAFIENKLVDGLIQDIWMACLQHKEECSIRVVQ